MNEINVKLNTWFMAIFFLVGAIYMAVLLGYSFVSQDYITVIIGGLYVLLMGFGAYFFTSAAVDLHQHKE
jgi:hypothetical protein